MSSPTGDHDPASAGRQGGEPGAPVVDLSKPVEQPPTQVGDESRQPASAAEPASAAGPRRWWRRRSGPPRKKSLWREIPILIIIALALALLIKTFIVQPFYIPSGSMEKTLMVNDRVLVNKLVYDFRDPKRGEIVVFNIEGTGFERYATPLAPPSNIFSRAFRNLENLFGLGPNNKDFIKRVIAIGGDTVSCCDSQGRVVVNGKGLDEPYVYRDGPDEGNRRFGPVTVAKGNLWVMGDHRNNSEDSRVGGQVPVNKVIGQAFVRVWPLSDWRGFGVPKTFSVLNGAGALGFGVMLPLFWRRRGWRIPPLRVPDDDPQD